MRRELRMDFAMFVPGYDVDQSIVRFMRLYVTIYRYSII